MANEKTVGAFWKQLSKDNKSTYLSGVIELPGQEKMRVVIFATKFYDSNGRRIAKPEDSKTPDFRMYLKEQKSPSEAQ